MTDYDELSPLAERMTKVARSLHAEPDLQATYESAVRLAAANVTGCDAASLTTVHKRGHVRTEAYTDDRALGSDKLQYSLAEGPCLKAAWEQSVVHSPDIADDPRWRRWGQRAEAQHDMRSVLCFQLFTQGDTLGALNLYSQQRAGFDEQALEEGMALAAHISLAIAAARTLDELTQALDTRTLIGQAVGIVMERYRLDAAAAFRVLARLSSESNVKVREIAFELVNTGHLPVNESL